MKMKNKGKWIWLPRDKYPNKQNCAYSAFKEGGAANFTVARFSRTYDFEKRVIRADLHFSGDTDLRLYCNGGFVATGPAAVGGDFLGNDRPRPNFYATEMTLCPNSLRVELMAEVKMTPVKICEYSKGHGGFMLTAVLTLEDGTQTEICTDESWQAQLVGAYCAPCSYDGRIKDEPPVAAEVTEDIWHPTNAPIPPRSESEVYPTPARIEIAPREEKEVRCELDMIYAGFVRMVAKARGILEVEVTCRETEEKRRSKSEWAIFDSDGEYRGFTMQSAGNFTVKLKNLSDHPAELCLSFITTFYPIDRVAVTETGDGELNRVLSVCRHSLKYCRQSLHLDSPRHCEPLACTGDYYIETLMTQFSYGDMRLAAFDLLRTAELLRHNDGRMFHTTYSLIWVRWLYDVYMITGQRELLAECRDALDLLLARFETYIGENGLIETPPDYMFVDWIYIDGLSMHHPPKALGQSCLNMFCFGALDTASKIYAELGDSAAEARCEAKREALRGAINSNLYDSERGMYFEGLNTETPEELLAQFMPQNVEKRYYLKHSNILAALFGVCDDERAEMLIEKVMTDECPGEYQPYFAHYLLEAVFRLGLREKYTLKILERWKAPVNECPKGLVEGFIVPEPSYYFDHSHAWGGTPLYSLPKALMGLEIMEPGMRKIRLSPSLLGLERARVELPTPYGDVICELEAGREPMITAPERIAVEK